ncbi:conserved hypothetical protein [Culex quinquefasciatus]|uniref:Metallo-beta-lactamase domain-containing protein 1 n=1 Tax=Culex quinquefasciatus TaxID=7176 RepID=B0WWB0_CULQU|nr:conserved hypothetical protein [Culex quinquefasciatus]|eukprot:XP_001861682.1 conserved hypothetical protein [Culex quinquefasciatus]
MMLHRLQEHRLAPDDISWVVSTHGHSDHLGNNNLFLKARHIVGTNISQRNRYFIHDFTSAQTWNIIPRPDDDDDDDVLLRQQSRKMSGPGATWVAMSSGGGLSWQPCGKRYATLRPLAL